MGVFAYGLVCCAIFFATFLYAFGFVAGIGTPTALDRVPGRLHALGRRPWA